jgi:hypothetical protein
VDELPSNPLYFLRTFQPHKLQHTARIVTKTPRENSPAILTPHAGATIRAMNGKVHSQMTIDSSMSSECKLNIFHMDGFLSL